jgi:dolichyl-phosphate-mannose--protein O-mannosyl transferase
VDKSFLNRLPIYFLIFFSFFTRFWQLYFPEKVVFDETHFALYANKYLLNEYYFDVHPPLGKMLFALLLYFFGSKTNFDFRAGEFYPNSDYLLLRSFVAFFGALLPLLVYFLMKKLGFSQRSSFLASFLIIFDNALLVQSRFILLDILLAFFVFLSLFLFFLQKEKKSFSFYWYLLNFLLSLSISFSISIKFIGFGILAMILFLEILEEKIFTKSKKEIFWRFFFIVLFPLFIYFFVSFLHLKILNKICIQNCGFVYDDLTSRYIRQLPKEERKEVYEILYYPPKGNTISQVFLLSYYMISTNTAIKEDFYYASKWYSWPFLIRPIVYAKDKIDDKVQFIFLLGNPIIWWSSFLGVVFSLYYVLRKHFLEKIPFCFQNENFRIFYLGYFIFLFPFAAISRFTLLYHYFLALLFSIIIFSISFDFLLRNLKIGSFLFFIFLTLVFLSFIFFAPLSFGIPLSFSQFKMRIWLPSWYF